MKSALVTGGGSGIGLASARALAAAGWQVAIAGRREQVLAEAAETSHGHSPILHHPVDVASRDSVATLFAWADEALGPIDLVVHAAGINIAGRSMAQMQPAEWDHVLAVNATGVYNTLAAVLPQMRERRDGMFILISSVAGKRATELGGVAYNASKFAATALGTTVGSEAARDGVRVTSIFPGEVNTPILDQRQTPPTDQQRAAMVQPDDVGRIVAFLADLPPHVHVPELIVKPLGQDYA